MKIISTKKYEYLMYLIKSLREERDELKKQNAELKKQNAELKKQLIYHKTWNQTFTDVIFPNTDERGLGEQEVPVNFPDLW